MKNYMFPAVLYFVADDGDFMLHIEDLNVFAYGKTVEEAQHNANDLVDSYVSLSLRIDCEIPEATAFQDMLIRHPKQTVLLIETLVDEATNRVVSKRY